MAQISFPAWLLVGLPLGGCIVVESTDDPPSPEDPTTPGPTDPDEAILPAVLRDAPVVLEDRVEDPSIPDYTAPEGLDVETELTIEPGVVIAFGRGTTMVIDGRAGGSLDATGTNEARIRLTGQTLERGAWGGIYVDNVIASRNRLVFVDVEYGGGVDFGAGLGASNLGVGGFVDDAQISVTNSRFRNSARHGVEVEPDSELVVFTDNTFAGNAGFDLVLPAEELSAIDGTNRVSPEGVRVTGGEVRTDGAWVDHGVPVLVEDDVTVDAALTIEAGVTLQFGDNVGLVVDGREGGSLSAVGDTAPIVFESADGVKWRGVWIDNTEASANRLENVAFIEGGFSAYEADIAAQLTIGGFVGTSAIVVDGCEFLQSAGDADIALQSDATVNDDIETVNVFDLGLVEF